MLAIPRFMAMLALVLAAGVTSDAPARVSADAPAHRAAQDGANRAALVVRFADGNVETSCVSFAEPAIYGESLLKLAGVELGIANDGRVCSISGVGCGSNDCWCQCTDYANCTYWAYYHLVDGAWSYSNTGAVISEVRKGDVEGWSWGKGDFVSAVEPPLVTFDQICNGTATFSTGSPSALSAPGGQETAGNLPSGSALGSSLPAYGFFLLIVASLALGGLWVMRRRTRVAGTHADRIHTVNDDRP